MEKAAGRENRTGRITESGTVTEKGTGCYNLSTTTSGKEIKEKSFEELHSGVTNATVGPSQKKTTCPTDSWGRNFGWGVPNREKNIRNKKKTKNSSRGGFAAGLQGGKRTNTSWGNGPG